MRLSAKIAFKELETVLREIENFKQSTVPLLTKLEPKIRTKPFNTWSQT